MYLPIRVVWVGDFIFGLLKTLIVMMLAIVPAIARIGINTPRIAKFAGSHSAVKIVCKIIIILWYLISNLTSKFDFIISMISGTFVWQSIITFSQHTHNYQKYLSLYSIGMYRNNWANFISLIAILCIFLW